MRIAVVAIAAVAVWFRIWEPFPAVSIIGVAGLLVGGWSILKEAVENIAERRMTMELSMTIAIVAAAAIGEFFTVLVITLFVLVAEVLEGLTVGADARRSAISSNSCRVRSRCAVPVRSAPSRRKSSRSAMRSWLPPSAAFQSTAPCYRPIPSLMNPASPLNQCRSRRSPACAYLPVPSINPEHSRVGAERIGRDTS